MKMKQRLIAGAVALSAMAGFAAPAVHAAETSATVAVANMYYWRGLDLGLGDPALIGDVNVSQSGLYAGLWASSGDAVLGTEWDFYAGYKFNAGPLSVDLNYTTYMYPSVPEGEPLGFDDIADFAVTLGYAATDDLSFSVMHRVGAGEALGDVDYTYSTLSATYKSFTALIGTHADDKDLAGAGTLDGLTHLDLTYAYSDSLSFTLGKVIENVDEEYTAEKPDELLFIVKLSLPIGK
jgi:uncharacterized protein (TIGR02001 family)